MNNRVYRVQSPDERNNYIVVDRRHDQSTFTYYNIIGVSNTRVHGYTSDVDRACFSVRGKTAATCRDRKLLECVSAARVGV